MSDEKVEFMANAVFQTAITTRRCAELWDCLTEGGSATVDPVTRKLVLLPLDYLKSSGTDADEPTVNGANATETNQPTEGQAERRFKVGDLVQINSEYLVHGNPSLFRIRDIVGEDALLGQLSSQADGFVGTDTWIGLDDPELVRPHPEILLRYARRIVMPHNETEPPPDLKTVPLAIDLTSSEAAMLVAAVETAASRMSEDQDGDHLKLELEVLAQRLNHAINAAISERKNG